MIKVENIEVFGWEAAMRGMRNPMNSWAKSDTVFAGWDDKSPIIGENDMKLMKNLRKAGTDHRKYLRMINVTIDITAPMYWWSEYDTYKVGTVANSCSKMHRIHAKEFTLDDFSYEHLDTGWYTCLSETIIPLLNRAREKYVETKDKYYWWMLIQLLPASYNQRRTVQLNYEVLLNMYHARKEHKLDEWREFCKIIESLPYFKEICLSE